MVEDEGDNKKMQRNMDFFCCNQNNYVFLQKQKTRGHHQHRIIWERALPGLRCKDNNKNGIYQRFFRKITSGRICCYVPTRLSLHRDVGNATSGRNFCCIVGGFSIKIIEKYKKLNRKQVFLLNIFNPLAPKTLLKRPKIAVFCKTWQ